MNEWTDTDNGDFLQLIYMHLYKCFFDTFVAETESVAVWVRSWGEVILPDSLSFLHINASSFHIYQILRFWQKRKR